MPKKKTVKKAVSRTAKKTAPRKKAVKKATKKAAKRIPTRDRVRVEDTWDLSSLFENDEAWEKAFKKWEAKVGGYEKFRGHIADDAKTLEACIKFHLELEREGERLGIYAFLKTAVDVADSACQAMYARFINIAGRAAEAASFIQPELLATNKKKMNALLDKKRIAPYRLLLERMWRQKPHTLGQKEERLLAMQTEMSRATSQIFDQLNDADMRFGTIEDADGNSYELTQGTFQELLRKEDRDLRRRAFHQFYQAYDEHRNTYGAALCGSIQKDVYYARARKYASSRESVLFSEHIPVAVYDSLIESVHANLPALHNYYEVRRRKMKLRDLHFYDTYVPIVADYQTRRTWRQAVALILKAVAPLGEEYCTVAEEGLNGRWCDRYENRGKDSGAFSCGSFDGDPYILMNYKQNVLESTFTLAHEAGHSMHSYYSAKSQPFQYYDYELFVAEVASTFNEQLLVRYMLDNAKDDRERAYLITREIDAIRGTIFRQTMFAEFEKRTHSMCEAGEPLTVDAFKGVYRELLEAYFGPKFAIDDQLELECFRIPHFYRAFYVYKYATGLSAAMALADRVLSGGEQELNDYLGFLKGGCSKTPLDLLRDAGVDMERPDAVNTALQRFAQLVEELDQLI